MYHIDRVIRGTGKIVDNGFSEIYVNAEIDDKSDVARLMKVFTESDTYDDIRFPATSSRKRRFKMTEEGVSEMCEVIERNRMEAKAELIIGMLKENLPIDMIARITKLTAEQITEIGKKNKMG